MMIAKTANPRLNPVIIDGVRTPFMRSHKAYDALTSYDLGRTALQGLLARTGIDPAIVEHLTMGTVIHDANAPNIARECLLGANLPASLPAFTVSLACISSNVAATTIADMISQQRIDIGIFSGVDTCSDPPIRVSAKMRRVLAHLGQIKGMKDIAKKWPLLRTLRLRDLKLDIPRVAEFSNGKTMGQGAEYLARQKMVSREDCDRYALRSHQGAAKAQKDGVFERHIIPVYLPPHFRPLLSDDGPRGDSSMEQMAKLRPAFDRQFGVCTAANSSFLTDGAAAVLMMSQERAKTEGLVPKAIIRDYIYRAGDAHREMLTGPALTIPLLLKKNNLTIDDIGVWEIHEAFAAQMCANLAYMKDDTFARERLGLDKAPGEIPLEKINIWGGSLAIGHPFGATGARLLLTAADRLQQEQCRFAIVSGCAAGGHGSAILLENPHA
jgi:acetyl-CoA acyltransferase